ncbi:hypothetical protein B7C42_02936 [Nocardia cerradoensis]|uniref:Uncharacterized protein n=1 Tax=Nocardia cerradoensis TaxID=85688 RepID=A0A231H800_9NOCA|nr:hypothetical protein B7C42_02936 [Nocardia cerradoensis]
MHTPTGRRRCAWRAGRGAPVDDARSAPEFFAAVFYSVAHLDHLLNGPVTP